LKGYRGWNAYYPAIIINNGRYPAHLGKEFLRGYKAMFEKRLELKPLAEKVRWDHSEHRASAEEYTALLWYAHDVEKVTIYRLAKCLGVTHGAIRFRLSRYGYLQPKTAKSRAYTPIKETNRVSS
jgi:hypothetical protein